MEDDKKPTREVDNLEIIRRLVELQTAKQDTLEAKLDAHRAESASRDEAQSAAIRNVNSRVESLDDGLKNLRTRVDVAETSIRDLHEHDTNIARTHSETELAHQAALGGQMAHAKEVDGAILEMRDVQREHGDVLKKQDETLETQNMVNRALCQELGLNYDHVASTGTSNPPEQVQAKPTTLGRIARENKVGVAGTGFLLLLQIILEILHRIH